MAILKAFKAVMSKGDDIKLDPEEIEIVMAGAAQGKLIRVKQGLINPSYLISIAEDKQRTEKWYEDTKYESQARRNEGMRPLQDVFKEKQLQLN